LSSHRFKVTVLVENTAAREDLIVEHGLAFLVEGWQSVGLFDTGQSDAFARNAGSLGLDLSRVSWIVLSHGHYDHTGGLKAALEAAPGARVVAHPHAFISKFARRPDGQWRSIGMTTTWRELHEMGTDCVCPSDSVDVAPGVRTTGEIPRRTSFETVEGRFFTQSNEGKAPDRLIDDLSLVLRTSQGVAVLLGCAHAGVINILRHVRDISGGARICAVAGGMHLASASQDRIRRTVDALREFDVPRIGLAHCTGQAAADAFTAAFGDRCFPCPAGTVIDL